MAMRHMHTYYYSVGSPGFTGARPRSVLCQNNSLLHHMRPKNSFKKALLRFILGRAQFIGPPSFEEFS